MERKPVRVQNPGINPALGVSVAAPFASLLPIGTTHRATTSPSKTLVSKLLYSSAAHTLTGGGCRIPREPLLAPSAFPHAPTAPSGFYSQDMAAKWASARLNARSQPDSNSQPLHIRRCLRRVRPQQKAVDRFDPPSSLVQQAWDERPWNMG